MTLNFKITDFRHIAGLQYVDDISIERNPIRLVDSIINKSVTDEILLKSRKYSSESPEGGSVRSRVEELCRLESIVSFFRKVSVTYKGINLYWMLKEKHENGKVVELYRHPNYKG